MHHVGVREESRPLVVPDIDAARRAHRPWCSWRYRPIVVFGESWGTEAALLTGADFPHLADAIVADSPSATASAAYDGTGAAWTFRGQPVAAGTP